MGQSSQAFMAESSDATVALELTAPASATWDWPHQPHVSPTLRRRIDAVAKRGLDIVLALTFLVLGLPFWLFIATAVFVCSPGPVLFRQKRCGKSGRLFTCYKFRTMVVDAERRLIEDAVLAAAHAGQWKLHNDPRVTSVGRWLRTTSLDEFPQVWNILRGDMSFVGPRPVQEPELTQLYGALADTVTSVRPGLTGLWQVSGRSSLTYDQRIQLDLDYVRHRGFWYDAKLIVKTVPAVVLRKGAV